MKVFWSWQSDTPGKIGSRFVRDAIKEAIADLKTPPGSKNPQEARVARRSISIRIGKASPVTLIWLIRSSPRSPDTPSRAANPKALSLKIEPRVTVENFQTPDLGRNRVGLDMGRARE